MKFFEARRLSTFSRKGERGSKDFNDSNKMKHKGYEVKSFGVFSLIQIIVGK